MMADLWTVVWKEWKEWLFRWGGLRKEGGLLGVLVFAGVFGVFLPLQMGLGWVDSPAALSYWAWVPLFLVTTVIADSFAGERERHTLETLLASRLPDRAILLGKVLAAVGYSWGLTMASLILGLVTVNLAHGQGTLVLYPAKVGWGIVVFSLLVATLAAGAGVLVSMRAATVKQAQQVLSIGIMLLAFVPIFGLRALPVEWRVRLAQTLGAAGVNKVLLIVLAVLIVLDLGLLMAAMARFRRAKLLSD
ncbi:MAG: ABC transporter permease [Firmicutes bacterium]|nr:ABC transporter permease [Bacillota bacterium]MCL5040017.1 ABC transporter permease [Bacillota bacterium]